MDNMTRKVERMVRKDAKRRLWRRFVAVPAAIVVFITTYALILPAIAMEGDVYCGFEEHVHTEECYVPVAACGFEEGQLVESTTRWTELACSARAHQHTEECYDEDGNVICGLADYLVHTHDAGCYSQNGALICPLPQVEEHVHDENCYVDELVNICGLPEGEGHIHSESCYSLVSHTVLACGQTESAGHIHTADCYALREHTYLACGQTESAGHIHTDACYTVTVAEDGTETVELTCGQEESAGHTHTDACYVTEQTMELVCGQAESMGHTHTDACYITEQTMELTCGQTESMGHTHTDACYAMEKRLVCTKPEVVLHTHTDECYTTHIDEETGEEVTELTCGQIVVEAHQHTSACFVEREQTVTIPHQHTDLCYVRNLNCPLPEHTHILSCYQAPATPAPEATEEPAAEEPEPSAEPEDTEDNEVVEDTEVIEDAEVITEPGADEAAEAPEVAAEPTLVCGLEEHTHGEECYDENGELICGLEEHTHDESCYAETEPAEAAEEPEVTAEPELVCGLEEHTHSEECYDENGELICGLEEHTHDESCYAAAEADEAAQEPEAEEPAPAPVLICEIPEHTHTDECYDENGEVICGQYEHEHNEYCWGEAICGMAEHAHSAECYDENGGLICDIPEHVHTAECCGLLIIEEEEAPIYNQPELICGKVEHLHTNDCISSDLTYICGLDEHIHSADCYAAPMKVDDGIVKSYNDGKVSVIAVYGIEANIPEEAVLNVYRLTPENPRYEARLAEAKALLNDGAHEVMDVELYNIGFYVNGVEVEPTAPVSVTFRFLDAARFNLNDNVSVVHFGQNGTEVLHAESDQLVNAATFETGSFSDFALRRSDNTGEPVQPEAAQDSTVEEGDETGSESEVNTMTTGVNMPIIPHAPSGSTGFGGDNVIAKISGASPDLNDFLKDFSIYAYDENGKKMDTPLDPDDPDTFLRVGDNYFLSLSFSESNALQMQAGEDGELVYTFPAGFNVKETPPTGGFITDEDGNQKNCQYWVDEDGNLHIKFENPEDALSGIVHFEVGLQARVTDQTGGIEIPIPGGGDQKKHFDVERGEPSVAKTASKYDPETRSAEYTVELKAEHGAVEDYTFTDTLRTSTSSTFTRKRALDFGDGDTVDLEWTVYNEDGSVAETGTVKDVKVTTDKDDQQTFSVGSAPQGEDGSTHSDKLPDLKDGQRLVVKYKAKLRDDCVDDETGYISDSYRARNEVEIDKEGKDEFHIKDDASVDVNSNWVDKTGEKVEFNGKDVIEWNVNIGTGDRFKFPITVTDTLGEGLTLYRDGSEGIKVKVYSDAARKNEVDEVIIPWADVAPVENNSFSYTLTEDALQKLLDQCEGAYYLSAEYYTTFSLPDGMSSGDFTNTVDTKISGQPVGDEETVHVVGPNGYTNKTLLNADSALQDGYLHYQVEVGDIVGAHNLMSDGKYYTYFRFKDVLTLQNHVGSGSTRGYVQNYPYNMTVTLEGDDPAAVLVENTTGHRYDPPNDNGVLGDKDDGFGSGSDNAYMQRTYKDSPYVKYPDGSDDGTEINQFYLVFNTDNRMAGNNASALQIDADSRLVIDYYISLDSPVYADKEATTRGYKLDTGVDTTLRTLRDCIEAGKCVVNTADGQIERESKQSKNEYVWPKLNNEVQKRGSEPYTVTNDDGTTETRIRYTVTIEDKTEGHEWSAPGKPRDGETLEAWTTHGISEWTPEQVLSLVFQDHYDNTYLQYVPGTLKVKVYDTSVSEANLRGVYGFTPESPVVNGEDGDVYLYATAYDFNSPEWTGGGNKDGNPDKWNWEWSDSPKKTFLGEVLRRSYPESGGFDPDAFIGRYGTEIAKHMTEDQYKKLSDQVSEYGNQVEMVMVFTYELRLKDNWKDYTGSVLTLINDATVTVGGEPVTDREYVDVETGTMDKTVEQNGVSGSFNFVIEFNKEAAKLIPEGEEYKFDEETLTMNDQMSSNLRMQMSTLHIYKVTVEDGKEVTEEIPFGYAYDEETNTHIFSGLPDQTHIRITYTAMTDDTGNNVEISNNAWVKDLVNIKDGVVDHMEVVESTFSGGKTNGTFYVAKQDAESNKPLTGAKFLVYWLFDETEEGEKYDPRTSDNKPEFNEKYTPYEDVMYGSVDGVEKDNLFVPAGQTAYYLGMVDMTGVSLQSFSSYYLQDGGRYVLVEVEAPTGYKLPPEPWETFNFYMDQKNVDKNTHYYMNDTTISVDNTNYNYELPETGGEGTMVFTLGGAAMLALAGAVFCGRQRRRARGHR